MNKNIYIYILRLKFHKRGVTVPASAMTYDSYEVLRCCE